MRVTVRVHRSARSQLIAWQQYVVQARTGGAAVAELLWDELIHELARKAGLPAGAERLGTDDPATFEWRFSSDTLIRYTMVDRPGSFFRQGAREISITSIQVVPRRGE